MSAILQGDQQFLTGQVGQACAIWRRFRKRKSGLVGLTVLSLMVLGVIIIPILTPFDIHAISPLTIYAPLGTPDGYTGQPHWLGTDFLGRDMLARLFVGGRVSLLIALLSTVFVVVIGTLVGAIAGYYGGIVDTILMRFTDLMLAIPLLPVYLFAMRLLRASPTLAPLWRDDSVNALLTLAAVAGVFTLFGWMSIARLVRGSVLTMRSVEFIEAARALGAGSRRIIIKHLLPNTMSPIIVAATFAVGDFIILEAVLAYFQQGVTDRPFPSWGNLLAPVQGFVGYVTNLNPFEDIHVWLFLFPSFMMLITVLSLNYIGDALRSALDPHRSE